MPSVREVALQPSADVLGVGPATLVTVPVVWVSYRQPAIISRGYWDQGLLERILDRRAWRPVGALDFSHHDGFEQLPADVDGAVVVVPAQHHNLPEEVERLNKDLARLPWVLLVLTGDECSLFPWRRLQHPNLRLWLMTPRPQLHDGMDVGTPVTFLGEGYHPEVPDLLANFGVQAAERPLDWFFAGQVTHERRRSLSAALRRLDGRWTGDLMETPGFTKGLPRDEYLRRMASAKVAPCPSGPGTPDSFRLYEALEAGGLPLADATTPEGWGGFWSFVYGDVPFPVVQDWADLPTIMEEALAGWPANANRASAWWQGEKRRLAYRLDDDVRDLAGVVSGTTDQLADLITVVMPTSSIPSHPSTAIIDETLDSLEAAGLGGCETIVMADGVRTEQAHRRAAYEEYLRALLWSTNHRRRNTLPLVFDDHLHQAEMTRRALQLVRTPLVLFVEHDTPLTGEIPWQQLAPVVAGGEADVVRLHHEADVLEPHRYLMCAEPAEVGGVRLQQTAQWSQRPHLARTTWYREMIAGFFPAGASTMIEDRMYGPIATPWVERREWGTHCRLWMYAPEGDRKRSRHLDGRADDPKFEMTW